MKTKTKKKKCCRGWEIDGLKDQLQELINQIKYTKELAIQNILTIYSADQDTAIGMTGKWHSIVCVYKDGRCEGGVRPHWFSTWDIREDGFHLRSFRNQDWKGWEGQYNPVNGLKYDELPRDVLALHHKVLVEHINKMAIYYPCHIFNDFTGELYRP